MLSVGMDSEPLDPLELRTVSEQDDHENESWSEEPSASLRQSSAFHFGVFTVARLPDLAVHGYWIHATVSINGYSTWF